jgi:membrane associated rhomboid family serine protease
VMALVYLCQLYSHNNPNQAIPEVGQISFDDDVSNAMQLEPARVIKGEVWRVFTYAFCHHPVYFFHVICTIIFLGWIGHQIEDIYGWREYVAYFCFATILGGVIFTLVAVVADKPIVQRGPSAAIAAILVLFAFHYPGRTMNVFLIPVPIWAFVGLYVFFDIYAANGRGARPLQAISLNVHLAGALFAFLYHRYTLRVLNWLPSFGSGQRRPRSRTKLKIYTEREEREPEPAATANANAQASNASPLAPLGSSIDEHLEAKLDEVLEKVTKSGKESLTEAERDILQKASAVYKKRRQG